LYRTLKDDPERRWHPLIKIKLLEATTDTLGECIQFAADINDMTSEGIQAQTLPLKIMTVRRVLRNLTLKQLRAKIPDKVSEDEMVEGAIAGRNLFIPSCFHAFQTCLPLAQRYT
jgi:hypothetical protein